MSHYDDDGRPASFEVGEHRFVVVDSGAMGFDSGRTRWHVRCETCDKVMHERTTSATNAVEMHLRDCGLRVKRA